MSEVSLYSDPYLKSFQDSQPKLFDEFFQVLVKSEFKNEIAYCLETPGWALAEIGIDGCRNPNLPQKILQNYLDEALSQNEVKSFWALFSSPNLSQEQIKSFYNHPDLNARGLALAHKHGDQKKLKDYFDQILNNENKKTIYVIGTVLSTCQMSDSLINLLIPHLSRPEYLSSGDKTIGGAVLKNRNLTPEQKVHLNLAGAKEDPVNANAEYWNVGGTHKYRLSSIALQPKLSGYLGYNTDQKLMSLSELNPKIPETFLSFGHPYSILLNANSKNITKYSVRDLRDLIEPLFMHRLFWRELCEQKDFALYRRNAYRTDDMFISHPILGREFEDADYEDATSIGGVFIFDYSIKWLNGYQDLSLDRAVSLLTNSETFENLSEIVEELDLEYTDLGSRLLALNEIDPNISEKYGFSVTDGYDEFIIEAGENLAEPDDYDVSVQFEAEFAETISWRGLSDERKEQIFEILQLGLDFPHSKIRSDCVHFLACMALHQDTPKALLILLSEIDEPLITEVLNHKIA